jgi:hypothetical protein
MPASLSAKILDPGLNKNVKFKTGFTLNSFILYWGEGKELWSEFDLVVEVSSHLVVSERSKVISS